MSVAKRGVPQFFSHRLEELKLHYEEETKKITNELLPILDRIVGQAEKFYEKNPILLADENEIMVLRGPAAFANMNDILYPRMEECGRVISKFPIQFRLSRDEVKRRIKEIEKRREAGLPSEPPVRLLFEFGMLEDTDFVWVLQLKLLDNHEIDICHRFLLK